MAFYHHITQLPSRFRLALSSFRHSDGLAFASVLPEEVIQQAFDEEDAGFGQDEDAIYTPLLTLWVFLAQILFKEEARSCAAAVEDLAELYHKRWLVELDIRAIRYTLGMDVLRCKTPEMVRREIWTCLLAYNLIRKTMLETARKKGLSPRQLSFTATLQKIAAGYLTRALMNGGNGNGVDRG